MCQRISWSLSLRNDSPISVPPGAARLGHARTLFPGPIEMFVIVGAPSAENTTVKGILPPLIVSSHRSHVANVAVLFGVMMGIFDVSGADGRQDVSLPAGRCFSRTVQQ